MKAKIQDGSLILPEEILRVAAFPKNGDCEVVATPGEVRVLAGRRAPSGPAPVPMDLLRVLREPAPVAPDDIVPDPGDEAD